MSTAPQIGIAIAGETRNVAISFASLLDSGELLTGTPTVTEDVGDLTITSKQVNTVALTINGATVAIGKAVQFSITGQVAGTTYTITAQCGTDATPAQTLKGSCVIYGE